MRETAKQEENLLKIYILEVFEFQKIFSPQLIPLWKGELQLNGNIKSSSDLINLQNWQEPNSQSFSISYTTDGRQVTKIQAAF